jgi:lipoprotein NlpI
MTDEARNMLMWKRLGRPARRCALLAMTLALAQPAAQAAPSAEEIERVAQHRAQVLENRVAALTRDLESGRLTGREQAEVYRMRGITLSQLNRGERAVEDFSRAVEADLINPQYYEDRAIGYIKLRRFAEANQDLDMALGLDNRRPAAHREKGRIAFYQGQFDQAARHFSQAMRNDRDMGVAYGAIWLHLALRRGKLEGMSALPMLAQAFPVDQWPAPVMRMLVDSATPEAVLAAAQAPDPESYLKLQCEAQFYVGEHYLIAGDRPRARAAFEAAVATGVTEFLEWDWARRELEGLAGG